MLYVVISRLGWAFDDCAAGAYPAHRHDGPWGLLRRGAHIAGESLGFKGVVCTTNAEWADVVGTMGPRAWSHHGRPCFK